jgi:hypothetical protein
MSPKPAYFALCDDQAYQDHTEYAQQIDPLHLFDSHCTCRSPGAWELSRFLTRVILS